MEYAFITVEHPFFGRKDLKISRNLEVKQIISRLFFDLGINSETMSTFYMKAATSGKLLNPTDTLHMLQIFDGEVLRIL